MYSVPTLTGCSLEIRHLIWDQGHAGLNPVVPTNLEYMMQSRKSIIEFSKGAGSNTWATYRDFCEGQVHILNQGSLSSFAVKIGGNPK